MNSVDIADNVKIWLKFPLKLAGRLHGHFGKKAVLPCFVLPGFVLPGCLLACLMLSGCQSARRTVRVDSDTRTPHFGIELAGTADPASPGVQQAVESQVQADDEQEKPAGQKRNLWANLTRNPLAKFIPQTSPQPEQSPETTAIEGREAF